MTDRLCPRCDERFDVTRDGVVDRLECPRCGLVEFKATEGRVKPGPPGGNADALRFGSNYGKHNG